VNGYRIVAKKSTRKLAHLFGKLPRLPYGVLRDSGFKRLHRPLPTTRGRSQRGPARLLFVNTYTARSAEMGNGSLSLHESVPGHHVQISLDARNSRTYRNFANTPVIRHSWRAGHFYSESSAKSFGLYRTLIPSSVSSATKCGRVRLGGHGNASMGLDARPGHPIFQGPHRQDGPGHHCEVDRYIVWPAPGARLQTGTIEDSLSCARRPSVSSAQDLTSASFTMPCSRNGPYR